MAPDAESPYSSRSEIVFSEARNRQHVLDPPSSGDAVDGDELAATQHAALPAPIASRDHSRPHLRRTPWSSNLSPWVAPKHTLSRSPGDVPLALRSQLQERTWCPLSYRDGVDADQSSAAFETRR
jgi:hypothetical protein